MKRIQVVIGVFVSGFILPSIYAERGQTMIDSSASWFPPHLKGAKCYRPPESISSFAGKYHVGNVVFVEDQAKCNRSVRQEENIFINTRCTYWDAMILAPWLCREPAEAILQRALHEVAHVALRHQPDVGISSSPSGLTVQQPSSPWDALKGQEGECWKWVFALKKTDPKAYKHLLESVRSWYSAHAYERKDWADSPEQQWAKFNKASLPTDLLALVPTWVKDEFAKGQ